MLKNRFQLRREMAFVLAVGAAAGAACGGTKSDPGGAGAAGMAGTSGWTYLPPGNDAGTATTVAGTGSSGTAGAAGSSGSGGSTVVSPTPFACNQIQPSRPGITSFDAFKQDRWTGPSNIEGGVYIYPEPLTLKPGDFLRYSDPVATYSGVGVWFAGCIDASKMKGVRFSMAGSAGSSQSLQFYLVVNRNRDIDATNLVGACVPDDPKNAWVSCRPPGVRLPVAAEPTIQTVLWTDFGGGLPTDKTDGSDILALQWSFDWSEGKPDYQAELTIDDLEFIPAEDEGAGGAGGMGGGGAGGSAEEPAGGAGEGGAGAP